MDTGVRDLEVAFFKANSTWFNDICSKNLSNRLIYAMLNTHNLGMILQLKDMPTVMNPVRIASSDWKSYKCYALWYTLSSKRVSGTPDFFYVFNLILSFSTCSQSFNKICVWDVLGANVLKPALKPDFSSVRHQSPEIQLYVYCFFRLVVSDESSTWNLDTFTPHLCYASVLKISLTYL